MTRRLSTTDREREPEPILFRQDIENGMRVAYAVNNWPARALIATELLDGQAAPAITINERGEIIISVANGRATYKRTSTQSDERYVILELCWSSWSPIHLLKRVGA